MLDVIFAIVFVVSAGISWGFACFMVKHQCLLAKGVNIEHESQEKIEELKEMAKEVLESASLNVDVPYINVKKENGNIECVEVANEKVRVSYNNKAEYCVEHLVESKKLEIFRETVLCMCVILFVLLVIYTILGMKSLI